MALTQSQTRQLVLVRYLFQIGIEQSHKGEPLASLAILPLHDSAELFLQSALEYCNGTLGGKDFMSYWSAFQAKDISLPYKDGMSCFNRARVSLKHDGTLPAHNHLEEFLGIVGAFLNERCAIVFSMELNSISLASLIRNETVRNLVEVAEESIEVGDHKRAIEHAALAFRRSLSEYLCGSRNGPYADRLFSPGSRHISTMGFAFDDGFGTVERSIVSALSDMQADFREAITVIAYNLDFDGYRYLKTYSPVIHEFVGGNMQLEWMGAVEVDKYIVRRCLDFVTNAALSLESGARSKVSPQSS